MGTDDLVFAAVLAARLLLPLTIFKLPLPGIVACLVLDGVDQTVFQVFTDLDLSGYQSYDKALDVYYLALAYIATMRNWVSWPAFQVARALFYYRLVGVAAFELTGAQHRELLLLFPNTFEYFFIFYEVLRSRWDPRRGSLAFWVWAAAAIWIGIKLPQEYWIHVAQLDVTDTVRAHPAGAVAVAAIAVVLAWIAVTVLRPRVPAPDHPPRLAAGPLPATMQDLRGLLRARATGGLFSLALLELIVLNSLVLTIFGRIMPGIDPSLLQVTGGTALLVTLNSAGFLLTARAGWGIASAFWAFVALAAVNSAFVTVLEVIQRVRGYEIEVGFFFIALLTLIVSTYNRYRPVLVARLAEQRQDAVPHR